MSPMASGPAISWEIDGETVETVSDFIFLGSKITTDGDCSHEIKRRLLLGRKVMTNLDSIFKSQDITLPTKVRLVKAMIFPGWQVDRGDGLGWVDVEGANKWKHEFVANEETIKYSWRLIVNVIDE